MMGGMTGSSTPAATLERSDPLPPLLSKQKQATGVASTGAEMRVHESDTQQEHGSSSSSSQMPPADGGATLDPFCTASVTNIIRPGAPPDETDDIADILHVGLLGGLVSGLSAAAKEFKPRGAGVGGGGKAQLPVDEKDDEVGFRGWKRQESWAPGRDDGVPCDYLGETDWEGEMQAEVQLQAELLAILSEAFPDCSPESLQLALAKGDWSLARASAAVMVALQAACDPDRPSKPCRHFLGGECLRKDCVFSHDFATTTCRFWLQGQCLNGVACLFLHDLAVPVLPHVSDDRVDEIYPSEKTPMSLREADNGDSLNATAAQPGLQIAADFPSLGSRPRTEKTKRLSKLSEPTSRKSIPSASALLHSVQHERFDGNVDENGSENDAAESRGANAAEPVPIGGEPPDDVLLAAVVSAKKGGSGGRKGGRGRKTRFTAVNIQALMRGAPAGQGNSGPNSWSPSASHSPENSREQQRHRYSATDASAARISKSLEGAPITKALASATRTTKNDLSFADVVGSTPPSTSKSINTGTVFGDSDNALVVSGGSAWGGVAGRRAVSSGAGDRGSSRGPAGARGGVEAKASKGSLGWVSTGEAVASQYQVARKEAAELARGRNKMFVAATEAFRRGQGLAARDLARRGRQLNLQMKEKHRQAAREIFNSRNPGDQVFAKRTIDLHGLHVSEAVTILDEELQALSERGLASVRVLTGSGHHSKGPTSKARLIPAVEHYCQSRRIQYMRVPDKGTGHVGVIDIALTVVTALSEYSTSTIGSSTGAGSRRSSGGFGRDLTAAGGGGWRSSGGISDGSTQHHQ